MSVGRVEDTLDETALDGKTDRNHQRRHEHEQKPKVQPEGAKRQRKISTDRVELAVRHVDDVKQAENDRQPQRHQDHGDT